MGGSKSSWGWNHQKKTQSTMYPVWWTLQFGGKTRNLKIKLTPVRWSNVKFPDVENVLSSHKVLSPEILPERSSPAETGYFIVLHFASEKSQIFAHTSAAPMSCNLSWSTTDSKCLRPILWPKYHSFSFNKICKKRRSLPKVPTCSWESQKHHEVLGQDNKKLRMQKARMEKNIYKKKIDLK